jgi:hypothetical protein
MSIFSLVSSLGLGACGLQIRNGAQQGEGIRVEIGELSSSFSSFSDFFPSFLRDFTHCRSHCV